MIYPKIPLAQSIIQICRAKGLTDVVISPGSRNAPLTIGFTNNPYFTCYSIADERCAAFFAMGIAQQTGKPAIVICTSGSALLNFYPAFAEAFYSQIPLVVISADRPPHMIDIGDGQTIRQENALANHSLYNANLTPEASEANDESINEAINKSYTKKGPVHINAPFEEPLYETVRKLTVDVTISAIGKVYKTIPVDDLIVYSNIWNASSRKLVLVGVNEPNEIDSEILDKLAADPSVVVMTETTSNLSHPNFIGHIDRIITPFSDDDFNAFRPEILVTLGGMVVSKRVKAFLRSYAPQHHWHIDPLRAYDTYGSLTKHFEVTPNDFFQLLLPFANESQSTYQTAAAEMAAQRRARHDIYAASVAYSDFSVYGEIFGNLPRNCQLHISNSAAIRYAQLFDIDSSIEVFCNRGTSGIDGSTSTAIGAAVGKAKPTLLITGDVSFFYDSNALWNNYIPKDFKIIIVNNGGGGIFRILPGHQENETFNTYFETSHSLTAEHLAKMYGFDYFSARDEQSLKESQQEFYAQKNKPCILEIFTPEKDNDKILKGYFAALE
jgi:2-succinyl-5-enolpyruvyl-6-hydroxy-3-cyclohexene-1-carboxylate synthase